VGSRRKKKENGAPPFFIYIFLPVEGQETGKIIYLSNYVYLRRVEFHYEYVK